MEKRVFILSSQPAFAELIRSALEDSGKYLVVVATSMLHIGQINRADNYSILILDIENPESQILDMISSLQQDQPHIRLIFLVTDSIESQIDAHNLVISRVIRKPFYMPHFLKEIERCFQEMENEQTQDIRQQQPDIFSEGILETVQKSLHEIAALTQATHIFYFSNGIPVAQAGIYNDLIVAEIQAFLISRAETPLHADLMKYKHFVGDQERSLIYFKVLPDNDLLVMIFNASIALIEAKKQVNTVIEGLQEKLLVSGKSEFSAADPADKLRDMEGESLKNDEYEISINLPEKKDENFYSMTSPSDSSELNQENGTSEQIDPLQVNSAEAAVANFSDQWGQLDEESMKNSEEIFEGWTTEQPEEGIDVNSTDEESPMQRVMDSADSQVELTAPTIFPIAENNEYEEEMDSIVNRVDDLLSEGEKFSTDDLLEGLIFPWDEEYQPANQESDAEIINHTTINETVGEWQKEDELKLQGLEDNSSLSLEAETQQDKTDHESENLAGEIKSTTTPGKARDRILVQFAEEDSIPVEMDETALEKEQLMQERVVQPIPTKADIDESLEKTQPKKVFNPEERKPFEIRTLPATLVSLNYTYVIIPRFQDHFLVAEISRLLSKKLPQLCIGFGWRLDRLAIRPQYLQCTLSAPASISPNKIIRMLRKETSQLIFAQQPEYETINPSHDFWAEGFILLSGYLAPSDEMLKDYLQQTRVKQGYQLSSR